MSNTSNPLKNFGLYFKVHLRFYAIYYLWAFAGIILSQIIVAYFLAASQPQALESFLEGSFWTYFYISAFVFTSSAFFIYAKKNIKMHLLTLPVSTFTKLATAFTYTVPIFWIVFISLFYGVAKLLGGIFVAMEFIKPFTYNPFEANGLISNIDIIIRFIYILIFQSVILMAGSFFPKVGFIKTVLVCILLFIIIKLIDWFTAQYSFDESFSMTLFSIFVDNAPSTKNIRELMPLTSIIWNCIYILLLPLSWYVAYLRVREMEV